MKEKTNIAELLKNCPTGMELDCVMFENVTLSHISESGTFPIKVSTPIGEISLSEYGCYTGSELSKCIIFPKGKTTWNGFHRPFKDGDVVFSGFDLISIYKEQIGGKFSRLHSYVSLRNSSVLEIDEDCWTLEGIRFATEEEKQKLFKAIKDNGYKWNSETKTLEKSVEPRFKVGDKVKEKKSYTSGVITNIDDVNYKIEYKNGGISIFSIKFQDDLELVPNKFDINTLKPFESKVLVRNSYGDIWRPAIYGFTDSEKHYVVGGNYWTQCIPYEVNKELLGTTNNPE